MLQLYDREHENAAPLVALFHNGEDMARKLAKAEQVRPAASCTQF